MQFVPIPEYYVCDAFEQGINAALVLERVMSDSSVASNMMTHLKQFLRDFLSSHNASDNKPYIGDTVLSTAPSMPAHKWAKENFMKVFPTLHPQTGSGSTTQTIPQGQYLIALINAIQNNSRFSTSTATSNTSNYPSTTSAERTDESRGMSKSELNNTLQMCGKSTTGDSADLPLWMQDCAAKGTNHYGKYLL